MKHLLIKTTYSLALCMFFTFYTFSTFTTYSLEKEYYQKADIEQKTLAEFQDINGDVQFLLRFSDRVIPVVQSKDNQDYVRKNIWNEQDVMGSAMIDYQSTKENIIIHAHSSIRNNEMFTPFKYHDYVVENIEFEIEDLHGVEKYQMISYMRLNTEIDEDLFFLETAWRNSEELSRHVENMMRRSILVLPLALTNISKLVTLVTCDATQDYFRYVIIAVPREGEIYELS